jgi:hypothetical protein
MAKDNEWQIVLKNFYLGYAPSAYSDTLTQMGNAGHASEMVNADILNPDYITQGLGLTSLGTTTELINYILDIPVASDETYGIGNTKLYKISSTAIASTGGYPYTITGATAGKTVAYLKGKLYYFFNTDVDSQIGAFDLSSTFDDDWQTGLIKATLIPVCCKEDIMLFGHGRYVGVYFSSTNTINKTKLDFGTNTETADICFNKNQWYIAINSGITGTNRTEGQVYLYDGGATTALLTDETGVGFQRIGFLYRLNGIVYVAYQDLTSTGYTIGYIAGSQIKPLGRFTGSLPTYAQKTLYKNTILFLSSGSLYSAGAVVDILPFQISQLGDGGYSTCGALAAPFGTPMVASTNTTDFILNKLSGNTVTSSWKSIVMPIGGGRILGHLDEIVVKTGILGANARCDLVVQYNQAGASSVAQSITGTGKTRHLFKLSKSNLEDIKIYLNWANGNTTNDCKIKEITLNGHFISR